MVRVGGDGVDPLVGRNSSVGFSDLAQRRSSVEECLKAVQSGLDDVVASELNWVRAEFLSSQPVVSFVGQVKAGKTALTNVVAGFPRLLPSDVNPWTSVVTSLHLNDSLGRSGAEFTFMDHDDWASFRNGGGRMGEVARRAGLTDEAERLRAQVDRVQARARARLGHNFELLVGKRHHHDLVTTDLISRYVCFDSAYEEDGTGRYADIVKTASVYLRAESHNLPLIFRDTPGINDPFLIREQATLGSLASTDVCVLTLSASQALNMSDVGLMKVVLSRDPDDVIIFVNRIDELEDLPRQISEIRNSIDGSLRHHGMQQLPQILFGSAIWADAALCGDFSSLLPSSLNAMERLSRENGQIAQTDALSLSGVLDLRGAIAASLRSGVLRRAAKAALEQSKAALSRRRDALESKITPAPPRMSRDDLVASFDAMEHETMRRVEKVIESHSTQYRRAFDELLDRFVEDQSALLRSHVDEHGMPDNWKADTDRWRQDLTRQHKRLQEQLGAALTPARDDVVAQLLRLYAELTGRADPGRVVPPDLEDRRPLVAAAATFAFDLPQSSRRSWFGLRQSAAGVTTDLKALLRAEARVLFEEIERENTLPHFNALRGAISGLIEEHRKAALALFDRISSGEAAQAVQDRLAELARLEHKVVSEMYLFDAIQGPDQGI